MKLQNITPWLLGCLLTPDGPAAEFWLQVEGVWLRWSDEPLDPAKDA